MRKMIRLDEPEEATGQVDLNECAQVGDLPDDEQTVVVRKGRLSEFVADNGVTYQRCGGGKRRLPKRSN